LEIGEALAFEVKGPIRQETAEESEKPEIEVGKAPVDNETSYR